jgi:VanZ family protein
MGAPARRGSGGGRRRALLRWAPALIWMGVIFLLSNQSDLAAPAGIELPDKLWHLATYVVLGILLWRAARPPGAASLLAAALIALAIGAGYGLSDEVHQRFVRGRSPDLADWAFDVMGIALGVLLGIAAARLRRDPL